MICPSNVSVATDPGLPTAVVSWTDPTAGDNTESNPTVACTPDSVSEFAIGIWEVVCEAIDDNGNRDKCVFSVNVTG